MKAFTLLELIVVVVILGVLALIAIPTFGKVIERSHDETALRSSEAFIRQAQALAALDQTSFTAQHLQLAASDMPAAAALGVSAAGVPLIDALQKDPSGAEVGYSIVGEGLIVAMESASGRVCIVGSNLTAIKTGSCRPAAEPSAPSTLAAALSDGSLAEFVPAGTDLGSGVTPPPVDETPVVVAPAQPTAVTAVAGDASAVVSFTPGDPGTAPVTYTVTASPGGKTATGPSPVTVTGLTNGTQYTFTVTASSSAGSAASAASAPMTPVSRTPVLSAGSSLEGYSAGYGPAAELGLRFIPSGSGKVTGVAFYKTAASTGTHTGSLWGPSGQLLATGTFTNESSSGWQALVFDEPVPVSAGVMYTASYYAADGNYAGKNNVHTASRNSGGLTFPVNAGVYRYGAGNVMPASLFMSTDYAADVLYQPAG